MFIILGGKTTIIKVRHIVQNPISRSPDPLVRHPFSVYLSTTAGPLYTMDKKRMESSSKDLLHLEHSTSPLESSLRVCKSNRLVSQTKKNPEKPFTGPPPISQVLGKVKDFLPVMSKANERLQYDAKDNSEKYDIETLKGDESQVIELDLMLGLADLHTPEAVAAAELAIAGCHPVIPLPVSSSETESDDSSDYDEDDGVSDDNKDEDKKTSAAMELKRPKSTKDGSSSEQVENGKSKKGPKIVELL